jgi:8-oxo-dGTP diphosphatase
MLSVNSTLSNVWISVYLTISNSIPYSISMITKKSSAPEEYRFAVLAADVVIFSIHKGRLLVRLTPGHRLPQYINTPALPGGIVLQHETAEEAVYRVIKDRAVLNPDSLYTEQLFTFSTINRDPRNRVVSVAYIALAPWEFLTLEERENTEMGFWLPVTKAKNLAYDHDLILATALTRILTELELCYTTIIKSPVDKRNFRKKILKLGVLTELKKKRSGGKFRPAQLYRFSSKKVIDIESF